LTAVASGARTCGDCGLCCKLLGVTELAKPPGKWCGHFRRERGCDAYDGRPASCRAFNCTWLLTEALDETWKPTMCGFLMHSDEGRLIVECDPSRPQAWRASPYREALERWAAAGQEVLIFAGKRGLRLAAAGTTTPVVRQD
jgi:hypothetical protein